MELTKIIESGSTTVEDNATSELKIRLIDIMTMNALVDYGEIRIDNADGELDGAFVKDADISVVLGLGQILRRIFTGVITEVFEGQVIIIDVRGNGHKLVDKRVKNSLNRTTASEVLRAILDGGDVEYEVGKLPTGKRHSYVIANGTIPEEIIRFEQSFDLDFIPYFDRTGKLILKEHDELVVDTDVEFDNDTMTKFEDNIIHTVVDPDIERFNKIKIFEKEYIVASNRFLLDESQSKSIIAVTEA